MMRGDYYAALEVRRSFRPYPAWRIDVGVLADGTWVAEYHNLFHPQGTLGYERRYFEDEGGALADARKFGALDAVAVA